MQQENRDRVAAEMPIFVACACDPKFVEPTATMLTSLDVNGDVPEATVLLAGFDLGEHHRAMILAGAGARQVHFIDITRDMLREVDRGGFTDQYPLPVLGRLFAANHVNVPGARIVTLDSDMIVNASLRSLFFRDLGDEYFAAIHDPPRLDDLSYFNSGLTMFDVDTYKYHNIADRCLQWIANNEEHPTFPDQDALNIVVGHRWHRLARTWNYFCHNSAGFIPEDYETCKVAHFAGPKPWDHAGHPGASLYRRYNNVLHHRLALLSATERELKLDPV